MLVELHARDLGVIADLTLLLTSGMTALTGETGAGKTLLVGAIELLVGGRADPVLVRPGAKEAEVEGRFSIGDEELVLARVVPRDGRSRAYVNGRMATASALSEATAGLVDLHGQHAHQSLLSPSVQRGALDRFAAIDLTALRDADADVAGLDRALGALGGDARARARELDLLRFQVDELAAAAVSDSAEDEGLEVEEDVLANAASHREGALRAVEEINGEGGVLDGARRALAAVQGRGPLAEHSSRLSSLVAELDDTAAELRQAGESIEDDPTRLAWVRARRQLLRELQRKYGESLDEVIAYAAQVGRRVRELESHDERAAELEAQRTAALAVRAAAAANVGAARRGAAPRLGAAVAEHLVQLAMPRARVEVAVGPVDPGDEVAFLLAANPGEPPASLAKVASGGELARAMLALRLVLSQAEGDATRTLVFDEVDAGIGGAAAISVGRSLAALGGRHQVLVVTHLPQVAAFADAHVAVSKGEQDGRTVADARRVEGVQRVVELSRMLSGSPDSAVARQHAQELLDSARR